MLGKRKRPALDRFATSEERTLYDALGSWCEANRTLEDPLVVPTPDAEYRRIQTQLDTLYARKRKTFRRVPVNVAKKRLVTLCQQWSVVATVEAAWDVYGHQPRFRSDEEDTNRQLAGVQIGELFFAEREMDLPDDLDRFPETLPAPVYIANSPTTVLDLDTGLERSVRFNEMCKDREERGGEIGVELSLDREWSLWRVTDSHWFASLWKNRVRAQRGRLLEHVLSPDAADIVLQCL